MSVQRIVIKTLMDKLPIAENIFFEFFTLNPIY